MRLRTSFLHESELIAQEMRRRQMQRYTRLLRCYSTLVFGQLLITASSEPFRVPESSAARKKPSKLRRVQELAEEQKQYELTVDEYKRQREWSEKWELEQKKKHREQLAKYGLPEDARFGELRERLAVVEREQAASRTAMEAEHTDLKRICEEAEGDPEKEVAVTSACYSEHPDSKFGCSYLIGALQKAGRQEEAVSVARENIDRNKRNKPAEEALTNTFVSALFVARTLLETGKGQEAVSWLQWLVADASAVKPNGLEHNFYLIVALEALGDAHLQCGSIPEARRAWKDAIHRDNCQLITEQLLKRLMENR